MNKSHLLLKPALSNPQGHNEGVRLITLLAKMVLESASSKERPAALEPENTEVELNNMPSDRQ